jgi:hypothetical protein
VLTRAVSRSEAEEPSARSQKASTRDKSDSSTLDMIDQMLESGLGIGSSGRDDETLEGRAVMGVLHKKSGGKRDQAKASRLKANWRRRFFVLPPASSLLSYYKKREHYETGREALGSMDVAGCTLFLKKVHHGHYRFTVASEDRELKLNAETVAEYTAWTEALKPHAATFRELTEEDGGHEPLELAEEEEDEEEDEAGRARGPSLAGRARAPSKADGRARSRTMASGGGDLEGYLEKKQGGKEGGKSTLLGLDKKMGRWERRYFVLRAGDDALTYYASSEDYLARRAPLGTVACAGAVVFVKDDPKDVAKGLFRFVRARPRPRLTRPRARPHRARARLARARAPRRRR